MVNWSVSGGLSWLVENGDWDWENVNEQLSIHFGLVCKFVKKRDILATV